MILRIDVSSCALPILANERRNIDKDIVEGSDEEHFGGPDPLNPEEPAHLGRRRFLRSRAR
jgi:hypothetical protein